MNKKIKILISTVMILLLIICIKQAVNNEGKICLNEIRSTTVSADRDGYFGSDYIEVYNGTSEEISIDGWYLSDDREQLDKSRISGVIIPARSYIVFYADGVGAAENSLNFKISSEGEEIFLSDSEGVLVDSVYVPKLNYGEVYARAEDGAKEWLKKEESMMADNSAAASIRAHTLDTPVFSHKSGFYEEPFQLRLECKRGEKIYYTLDGSIPTKESLCYDEGILIENITAYPNKVASVRNVVTDWLDYEPSAENTDKAMIVRAVAMDQKGQTSEVVTHTYFVDLEQYKDRNVLSVVGDYDEMFGDEGIFVTGKNYDEWYLSGKEGKEISPNFAQSGRQWEILGNIQILQNGQEITNQQTGIRIHGGSSRQGKVKKLGLFSREIFSGDDYFTGLLLGDHKVHSMATDDDAISIALQQLVKDRNAATQNYMETAVFLNGEFYGNHYLLEKYNQYYLEQAYGVNSENVIIIKDGEVSEGTEDEILLYYETLSRAKNKDLTITENYEYVKTLMDVQSYIDFLCANIYLCNMDVSETKNYSLWRVRETDESAYGDGRWRWMLYDMDCIGAVSCEYYGVKSAAQINSFSQIMEFTGQSFRDHMLYSGLKVNEEFCRQFVLTFMDMANVNFAYENVVKVLAECGTSTEAYGNFFEKRFDYIVSYMAEEFKLKGTLEDVTLKINDAEAGSILLNTTTPDLADGNWSGKYYTDYPVTVTAVPKDGYRFIGWKGSETSKSTTIEVEVTKGGIILEAVFEKISK